MSMTNRIGRQNAARRRVWLMSRQAVLWFGGALSVYLATLVLRLIESSWE